MKTLWFSIIGLFAAMVVIPVACEQSDDHDDVRLTGNTWTVVSLTRPAQTIRRSAENTYMLEFVNDTSYTLGLDVNHCSGKYRIQAPNHLEFTGPICTEICCDTEYAIDLACLIGQTSRYRIEQGYLILTGDETIMLKREN